LNLSLTVFTYENMEYIRALQHTSMVSVVDLQSQSGSVCMQEHGIHKSS
jgi:hypothetical protein